MDWLKTCSTQKLTGEFRIAYRGGTCRYMYTYVARSSERLLSNTTSRAKSSAACRHVLACMCAISDAKLTPAAKCIPFPFVFSSLSTAALCFPLAILQALPPLRQLGDIHHVRLPAVLAGGRERDIHSQLALSPSQHPLSRSQSLQRLYSRVLCPRRCDHRLSRRFDTSSSTYRPDRAASSCIAGSLDRNRARREPQEYERGIALGAVTPRTRGAAG
jgi:hypothetical protein